MGSLSFFRYCIPLFLVIGMAAPLSAGHHDDDRYEDHETKNPRKDHVLVDQIESPVEELQDSADFKKILDTNEVVIAKFHSPACPHCKHYAAPFAAVAQKNPTAKFVAVNVLKHQALAKRNKVSSIPATVMFKNGEEVNRLGGNQSKEILHREVNNAINAKSISK